MLEKICFAPQGSFRRETAQSESTIRIGDEGFAMMMRALDMVPPNTKLAEVGARIAQYQASEKGVSSR